MIPLHDVSPLAQGGTADLFTARSGRRRVVVKVARADRPGSADALAAEASVLAMLAASPAPRLIGRAQLDGRDALVLEHIDLPVLRAAIASAAQRPVLDRLALALAVCEAVARLHDAGAVHADLTPDNILLDPASRAVRVIDFGLAAPVGAPLAPLITVGYAAPERLVAGCRASAAVDVYALGVICYELIAGAPPFDGSARVRSVGHAIGRVPRVSERVAVSSGVDDAIAQAMAKAPDVRPADAGALATLLARAAPVRAAAIRTAAASARGAIVGFTWTAGVAALRDAVAGAGAVIAYSDADRHVAAIARGDARAAAERLACALRAAGAVDVELIETELAIGRHGVPISPAVVELGRRRPSAGESPAAPLPIASPPLIGRAALLASIDRASRGGDSALIAIWGELGIGKSRLAEAICDQLTAAGTPAIHLRAPSLAELADRLDTAAPAAPVAARLDAPVTAALDARLDAIDRAALGAVTGRSAIDGSAAAPFAAAPGALRQAAARALARAIAAAGCVVVIDDAHDADPVALDAIELATMDGVRPAIAIALARPALAVTRPRWGRRAARLETFAIDPLTGDDGRQLIRALLPATAAVPGAALDRLIDRCGGVPLYVIELVSALRRAGGGSAVGTRGALPTDLVNVPAHHDVVAWAVADELAALPADPRAAAEAIAVAGRPLAPAEISPLFAALEAEAVRIELDAGRAVAQLLAAGLLIDRGGALGFRHAIVRDAIAARVTDPRCAAIHRAMLASGLAITTAEVAHHAERAGDCAAAALAWRRAAGEALARHDDLAAEARLGRALVCAAAPDPALLRQRGAARSRLGRHDAAASDFAAARGLALASGDRAGAIDVLLDEATALDWSLHHAATAARVVEAAALAGRDEPPLRRARLAMARGRAAWRAGDGRGAVAPLRDAIAIADPLGGEGYETAIASRVMLGFVLGASGDIAAAAAILDEALAEATARGDLLHAAAARLNRYPVHAARGDAAALRDDMAALAAAGRELGVAVTEYRGELYQALVAVWCGDDALAARCAAAARRLEAADAALFPRPAAAVVLAELAARAGDRSAAAAWCGEARAHGAPSSIDRIMLDALDAWLADRLDLAAGGALAGRAAAIGEPEAGYQVLALVARTAKRALDRDTARAALAAARALPNLPRLISERAVV